ncbi:TRAP transporter small permease subunit DctQ [Octadecabacter antarcticus 307]|uniref:TRAP transporter small permease protein n=1 Tax=Octadecabacter antarcticus 307 TaxID=391626 RepID=M9RDX8_9RHOB|nr:TRAP transporter small permease [Octadecabacter antarcticus]AGI68616.1 TRAP transporter small permease subunit DctQ [Octadecabacter antarcticus 307]
MAILKWLDQNIEKMLVSMLLAAIVLLIFANVIMRYVMNASLSWGEELTLWFFVWFVWLAVSYAFQNREHVRITVLRDLLSERVRLYADIVIDLLVLAFLVMLTIECVKLIMLPFVASQNSVVLGLPIPILYASAPVGAALSSIRVVQNLIRTVRTISAHKT